MNSLQSEEISKLNARNKTLQAELERVLGQASKQGFAGKEAQYLTQIKELTERADAAEVFSSLQIFVLIPITES